MKPPLALGFTLIELLVTIAMIAIVTAIGVPAFKDTIRNNVLTAGMNDFIATLNFARSEAVKRGVSVTARKTSTSTSVGWESGWEVFTDAVIHALGSLKSPIVFVLWGAFARKKISLITQPEHTIIESAHPSPLSAHNGFFGSKPFSHINQVLTENGSAPIDWKIPNS